MKKADIESFAREWIDAWNAHDLERILSHYADEVRITSPIAEKLTGNAEITGKDALRRYFAKGLAHYPDLHFDLQDVLAGSASLVLIYVNQNGTRAAEMMALDAGGKIVRMVAHYDA